MKVGKEIISILSLLALLLLGFQCKSQSNSEDENLLIFFLGASSRFVGDGCNYKTDFTICVPPGIGGN